MSDLQERLASRLQEELNPCDWQGHDLEKGALFAALQAQGLELIAPSDAPVAFGIAEDVDDEMTPVEFAVNLIVARDSDLASDFVIHSIFAAAILEDVTPLALIHALANGCPPVDRWMEIREQLLAAALEQVGGPEEETTSGDDE